MIQINQDNFETEIFEPNKLIVIDFWASWCNPCKFLMPIMEEVSNEVDADRVKIVKIKIDDNRELAKQFGVMSVPTLIFMRDGDILELSHGFINKKIITEKINSHLN